MAHGMAAQGGCRGSGGEWGGVGGSRGLVMGLHGDGRMVSPGRGGMAGEAPMLVAHLLVAHGGRVCAVHLLPWCASSLLYNTRYTLILVMHIKGF